MGAYLAHWRIQVAKIIIKNAYDTIPPPAGLDPRLFDQSADDALRVLVSCASSLHEGYDEPEILRYENLKSVPQALTLDTSFLYVLQRELR